MVVALAVASLVVCAWAAWIFQSLTAPRWTRAAALLAAGVFVAVSSFSVWALQDAFASVDGANPSQQQALLSTGIASAMTVLCIGGGAVIVALIALTVMRLRRECASKPET